MTGKLALLFMMLTGMGTFAFGEVGISSQFQIEKSWDIGEVPAGFPVRFCLLTSEKLQYVAYYDKERRMTIASRALNSDTWQYQILPSNVKWDSHNYITMAVDDDGYLHVSGNMHCVPLIYFRAEKPEDISTLKQLSMTGRNENKCTYPKFMRDADNRLIFHYRDGSSGKGNEIYNVYDLQTKRWSRLLDEPLTDGQGRTNAYMTGPARGPDNWFHLVWVWRDTPDCATNHHLSYARSRDLRHWESVFAQKIELPITLDKKSLWVDPIPSGGGIINGGHRLFFDANNRPIITYHKSDPEGNMQIYAARPKEGRWQRQQLTDWDKPVEFSGGGAMPFIGIRIGDLKRIEPGVLTMTYRHRDYGSGRLFVDEKTLRPSKRTPQILPEYPKELGSIQNDFEGMQVKQAKDIGDSGDKTVRYILKWETLGANHDRPRQPPLPEPGMLKLYKLVASD